MAKAKGLGRGLDALLGGDEPTTPAGAGLAELPIDHLRPGKYQPRTQMDDAALRELADSIKTQGVMQPILVRPLSADRYEIIAGERRWRAARIAGLSTVPAQIRVVPDHTALAMALIENLQREDLNALEEATGIQRLIGEFGMTHEAAAAAVGRSRTAVTNLLRLLALPAAVRELLQRGVLDMGHARALLALSTGIQQVAIARRIVEEGWSVRVTEKAIAQLAKNNATPKRVRPHTDRDVLRLQEELSQKLGTRVAIKTAKNGCGTLLIYYTNLTQLDAILARLKR